MERKGHDDRDDQPEADADDGLAVQGL